MEKTYRIKPLQWHTDSECDDYTTHEATGTNYYYIQQEGELCDVFIYDDAGDFTRESLVIAGINKAKRYCEAHYIERMKSNLIEL